ncbi:hypothetical protein RYX36_002739 [Vicia faba]
MFPGMHPALIPGLTQPQIEEHGNCGAGIYVVPVNPFDVHVIGLPYTKILIANYAKNNDPNFELLSSTSQGFFPYDFCIICIRCFRFLDVVDVIVTLLKLVYVEFSCCYD